MKPVRTFTVLPSLPSALEPLRRLAGNLRWSWHPQTLDLFRGLGGDLWETTGRNPTRLLSAVDQSRLEELADDESFVADLDRSATALDAYMDDPDTWFARRHGPDATSTGRGDTNGQTADGPENRAIEVAYFSMEYGVTDCVSIFSGGLGMLAGDHLKSASDLGVPLVGIGLFYHQGYFEQRLNDAGWQHEVPAGNNPDVLPLTLERDNGDGGGEGAPLTVELGLPDGAVTAQVWRADVGRVPLYLLDANVPANTPEQRRITHHLYGGDTEMRMRQEILLGVGGRRVLAELGHEPTVYHMNEGHAAFLALEQIRRLMTSADLDFDEAREIAAAQLAFTTHTPVEAGHDYFPPELAARYFQSYAADLGLDWPDFLALGRHDPDNADEPFCMTVLALKLAARSNGVSRLHGEVSRSMWAKLWPAAPEDEVPIGHITNGVHLGSWLSREIEELIDRRLGTSWRGAPPDQEVWDRLEAVPDEELWRAHTRRRRKLIDGVRRRVRTQLEHRGAGPDELAEAGELLDPDTLTIGFARRFATYKRATLIARDRDRLARLMSDPERPVQLIVAGKAHPLDDGGKELIRRIVELSREEDFRGRIVFVEDYHMALARYLVAGCDVWLNNPVRPREASGTSGMKAAVNGVLNLSTLDGWWDEAWADLPGGGGGAVRGESGGLLEGGAEGTLSEGVPFGWAIGRGIAYEDRERQDEKDAEALYSLLEHDVIPTFYDRDDGLPRAWIARMRQSMRLLGPRFNTHRMVADYVDDIYVPATADGRNLATDGQRRARQQASWRRRVTAAWAQVECRVLDEVAPDRRVTSGAVLRPRASVQLGDLEPDDVAVEVYVGRVGPDGDIHDGQLVTMAPCDRHDGRYVYQTRELRPEHSGRYGYTVRVRAQHPERDDTLLRGCVTWAGETGESR